MTLVDARKRATKAIHDATRGTVTVASFDGVMDTREIKAQSMRKPATVYVSVMGRDADRNIVLAAYVVAEIRPERADDAALDVVDTTEEAMRTLLGAGRPLLEVRTQTLYDPRATRAGAVALWAVTAALPSLVGDAEDGDEGLVHALDDLLGQYLRWRWASTEPQRGRFLLDGPLPFALVTYGADSEVAGSSSSAYRYRRGGTLYERSTLGRREVTAQVELLGRTEEEVETELDRLLAQIPRTWTYEGLTLPVHVRRVVGSHWRRKEGAHAAVAEVRLQAAVPQGEERVVQTRRLQDPPGCDDTGGPPAGRLAQDVQPEEEA